MSVFGDLNFSIKEENQESLSVQNMDNSPVKIEPFHSIKRENENEEDTCTDTDDNKVKLHEEIIQNCNLYSNVKQEDTSEYYTKTEYYTRNCGGCEQDPLASDTNIESVKKDISYVEVKEELITDVQGEFQYKDNIDISRSNVDKYISNEASYTRMKDRIGFKDAHGILSMLEEVNAETLNDVSEIRLFISPPEVSADTDEDSGDEDNGGTINDLNGRQLQAECEVSGKIYISNNMRISCPIILQKENETSNKEYTPNSTKSDERDNSSNTDKSKEVHTSKRGIKAQEGERKWSSSDLTNEINTLKRKIDDFSFTTHYPHAHCQPLSPSKFFEFFFNDNICTHIIQQSVTYAFQKGQTDFTLSIRELKTFLGILILSGYVPLPRRHMYWEKKPDSHNAAVSGSMRRSRFEEIARNIHLNDNNDLDANDRLSKVRPYLDHLKNKFIEFATWEKEVCIDEAMVLYYGRHGLKQYIKGKPIRFGYKIWCMNFRFGYLIDFDVYQGSKGPQNKYQAEYGLGAGMLLKFSDSLLQSCYDFSPFHIFADNYFLSLKVTEEFSRRGIGLTGTIRSDRIGNCPIASATDLSKTKKGSFDYRSSENSVIICRWNDNSVVTMISNCEGVTPVKDVSRYSASDRKKVKITQPLLIKIYNNHMGGTDRMDQNIACYRTTIRSKKWWWPLFLWGIDVSLQNAWLLYRNMQIYLGQKEIDLLDFRRNVALSFLQKYGVQRSRSGRTRTPTISRVPVDIRFDKLEHFLGTEKQRIRCAVCKSQTVKRCKKCNVALHNKCFEIFHTS